MTKKTLGKNPFQVSLGITLVETMITITLSIFLVFGLLSVFGSTSRSFKIQGDYADRQSNGTLALRYLTNDLRLAGYFGSSTGGGNIITTNSNNVVTNDCSVNWAIRLGEPIRGYSTASAMHADLGACFANRIATAQTILVLRSAAGDAIPYNISAATNYDVGAFTANTLYVSSDPAKGVLFAGGAAGANGQTFTSLKSSALTGKVGYPSTQDAPTFPYQFNAYYIRGCSRTDNNVCSATSDSNRPIPTLTRVTLQANQLTDIALVEGVEAIGYCFGIDTANDGVADLFLPTEQVTDWGRAVSARVSVLVRSTTPTSGYTEQKTYQLGMAECPINFDPVAFYGAGNAGLNYQRMLFTQMVQLRNLAQQRKNNNG